MNGNDDASPATEAASSGLRHVLILSGTAVLLAALFGALHNQLSYTVAPEYFTKFKFPQFGIAAPSPRLGASLVGVLASWWMGIPIGLALGVTSLKLTRPTERLREALRACGVVLAVTILVGLGGLFIATRQVSARGASAAEGMIMPESVVDRAAFYRAGVMHGSSYLGGISGVVIGMGYLAMRSRRENRRSD